MAGRLNPLPRQGRRLKGLDEFETPEFVGRMDRNSASTGDCLVGDAGGRFSGGCGVGAVLIGWSAIS